MKNNPAQKIIDKIKKEKIVPESKIFLNWKNYLFWIVWIFTLILGAIFFSFIILNLLDIHPFIFRQLGLGKVFFIFARTAPYLWIFLAFLAVGSGFLAIRKTKRGYRYGIIFITSIAVLVISILGAFLHIVKINKHLGDRFFIDKNMSRELAFPIEKRWKSPEDGMLGGKIIDLRPELFILEGFGKERWEVFYSDETEFRIKNLENGEMVEVLGEKYDKNKFRAFIIQKFPFERTPLAH